MTSSATSRVHLLLQVDPGMQAPAVAHVGRLPAVHDAVATSGSYDVIATVDVPSEQTLSSVLAQVRRAPGLCALRLCRAPG